MASFEWVRIQPELTYGTAQTIGTPVKNTDYIFTQLVKSNSQTMRVKPKQVPIRTADAWNRVWSITSAANEVSGNLSFLAYYEQMPFLATWAITLNANGELPSCTLDHGFQLKNASGTVTNVVRRYLGVKVNEFHLSGDKDSQVVTCNLGLIAQKPDPTFVTVEQPSVTADLPANSSRMLFQHLASPGHLELTGSNRSEFASIDLDIKTKLDGTFNESPWITRCPFKGRDITYSSKLVFSSAADRTAFEATTPETCELRFDNSTNHAVFGLNANNYFTAVDDDLSFDNAFYQTATFMCGFDPAAGADITVTNG